MNEPGPYSSITSLPQVLLDVPGDIGELAKYIYGFMRYQEPTLALAGAISIYSGFVGKAFNEPGDAGLNTYTLFLAPTGVGKNIIKEARGRLFVELMKTVPAVEDFKGPGDLGSAAGAIRWLEKRPCCLSIFGEFGPMLKKITGPRINANDEGIQRFILDGYSSSGEGSSIDPIAYSDRDKNTATIYGASYSIFAESVPERIYESLNEGLIASGLLPRFDVWESNHPRPYMNRNRITEPPVELVNKLANVAAHCLSQGQRGVVTKPTFAPGVEERLYEFEAWTTDQINASGEVARHLWNRAYLKAAKLASLRAVGINHIEPVITLADVEWAGHLVSAQTLNLLSKFASGEVGEEAGNESKQRAHILRAIANYFGFEMDWGNPDRVFRANGIIRQSYIQAKVFTLPAFKNDRRGATKAIKDMLHSMSENGELQMAEAESMQSLLQKKCKARAYFVAEPKVLEKYWPESSPFRDVWTFFQTLSPGS